MTNAVRSGLVFAGLGGLALLLMGGKPRLKAPVIRKSERTGVTFGIGDRVGIIPSGFGVLIPSEWGVTAEIVDFPMDLPGWTTPPVRVRFKNGEVADVEIERLTLLGDDAP